MTATGRAARIARILERKHRIGDDYYPGCSLHLQIAGGLAGDAFRSLELLSRVGQPERGDTVLAVMQTRKSLMKYYTSAREASIAKFNAILLDKVRPIGGISPAVYELAQTILIALVTYGGFRFVGSFASEAGKIAAQKLLAKEPQAVASELNIQIELVDFLKSELSELSENNELWREIGASRRKKSRT